MHRHIDYYECSCRHLEAYPTSVNFKLFKKLNMIKDKLYKSYNDVENISDKLEFTKNKLIIFN